MQQTAEDAIPHGSVQAVRLRIPAKPEYITLVRLALSGLSRLRPFDEETLGDLKLAVTEACSNSVRHGYASGAQGTVEVSYELHPDRLVVEVEDEGPGFDPNSPRAPRNGLTEGGLGIAIIQSLADEFEAGARPQGGGMRLRFVKFLDA
jgi:serine/threonine-protein kinase RsbW